MGRYIVRRVAGALLILVLMSFVTFMLINVVPGNTLLAQLAETGANVGVDAEVLALFERELGLDRPVFERYADWILHVLQGDLVVSFRSGGTQTVVDRIGPRLPISIELVVLASLISFAVAVPIGVLSAVRQRGPSDYAARMVAILGLAIPNFFLATVLVIIFSRWFDINLASLDKPDLWDDPIQNLQGVIVPVLVLGFGLSGALMRMARSSTLEVLHEDYVRTARAKGLGERVGITRHVLRNILIPIVTIFGTQVAFLLGGTVIVEFIFGLHGIGDLFYQSVRNHDYPVVMGTALLLGFVVVTMNLLVDLSYAVIDPRIRYT